MNIRERLKKKSNPAQEPKKADPAWLCGSSKTTKLLYNAAKSEYLKALELIKTEKASSPKSSWLVRATIAAQAGFDRSIINPRRQLEICHWIDQKNHELDELYSIHKPITRLTKQKTRRDLEKEISRLRKQDAERIESDHRAIVEAFFSSNMLNDRNVLRQENSRLRNENRYLSDAVAQLQQLARDNEIKTAQLWEVLEPNQRIKLGWRPDLKPK